MIRVGCSRSTVRYTLGPVGSTLTNGFGTRKRRTPRRVLLPESGSTEIAARIGECVAPSCAHAVIVQQCRRKSCSCARVRLIVIRPGLPNNVYRIREHLTEAETDKLLAALKRNRHGHRDWLIGLVIYRHGLRGSEACDLRWDDIDLPKRTIIVRRLKASTDSVHYLERDEVNGLKLLHRQQQSNGIKAAYVFINERGQPFGRMGIGRMIERAGEAAGLPFPVHVHMLRHDFRGHCWPPNGLVVA